MVRALILFFLLVCSQSRAQTLIAEFETPPRKGSLILLSTTGGEHHPIDSVIVAERCVFNTARLASGFYQLALNDSDRVDVIIDRSEPEVVLRFARVPLQQGITVIRSDENLRLWEYKAVSRQAQQVRAAIAEERKSLPPTEFRQALRLDSMDRRSEELQRQHLLRLTSSRPDGCFAKITRADMAIEATAGQNPMRVVDAFDLSDPTLLRSSVYDKAVLYFLRNLNAVSEEQFIAAADTLIGRASHDPDCRAYMLQHLVDLFSTYGPDMALQFIVDHYVAPFRNDPRMSPALLAKVDGLLKVAVGAIPPDVQLPLSPRNIPLSEAVRQHRLTTLFFYSSTCDHCHAQMPKLKEVYDRFKDEGLGVYGIALDPDSTEFSECITDYGLTWPCGSEFTGWGSKAAKAFEVKATPAFYLLDRDRRIVAKPIDADVLATEVEERLGRTH